MRATRYANTNGEKLDIDRLVAAVNSMPETYRGGVVEALKIHFPEIMWCRVDTGNLAALVQQGYKP